MSSRVLDLRHLLPAAATVVVAMTAPSAHGIEILDFYLGGGMTRGEVKADVPSTSLATGFSFSEHDNGWKAIIGIRPLSLIGAELEYLDFGSPSVDAFAQTLDADLNARAAFVLLYLPLPLPFLDIYAKGGYAQLKGHLTGTVNPNAVCTPAVPPSLLCSAAIRENLDDDGPAAGAGVQFKLGSWAIRAEYERFFISGTDPGAASLSLTKSFL